MQVILNIQNLSKKYLEEKQYAVNNISFSIKRGEILALIGESGCGKTTILRLIAGFETPNQGSIFVDGKTLVDLNIYVKPEKRKLGMVFQDYALFPHLNVEKNILYGVSKKDKNRLVTLKKVILLTGLNGLEKKYPHQLSGGQQQRVALARTLAPKPNLILLDEPFSNLDEPLKNQVREDVTRIIKQSGATAIFVTHDTRDAFAAADKIAVLKDGQIKQFGTPSEIFESPKNKYVAQYFGKINFLKGIINNGVVSTVIGEIKISQLKNTNNRSCEIGIRASQISLNPIKSSLQIRGKIKSSNYYGNYIEVRLEVNKETIIADLPKEGNFEIGKIIDIYFNIENLVLLNKN